MMRVGWLADRVDTPGGAELTQREFRDAAPARIEIVDCPPGGLVSGLDAYVAHNVVQYTLRELESSTDGALLVKYHHDVGPHVHRDVKLWLKAHATHVVCSPAQARRLAAVIDDPVLIPPPVDVARFRAAAADATDRRGTASVAAWMNAGKASHLVQEWARDNLELVDFFGAGPYAPPGSMAVRYEDMPALLARYERFVYLPTGFEPFCRTVVEAWAAGCEVITNQLVGATWWIEREPERIATAAADFWDLVTSTVAVRA